MKCPYCKKEVTAAPYTWHNADAYDQTVIARTGCCKKLVYISAVRTYKVTEYRGKQTVDDWGK